MSVAFSRCRSTIRHKEMTKMQRKQPVLCFRTQKTIDNKSVRLIASLFYKPLFDLQSNIHNIYSIFSLSSHRFDIICLIQCLTFGFFLVLRLILFPACYQVEITLGVLVFRFK